MAVAVYLSSMIACISGILVYFFPNLISGYRMLPDSEKEKINWKALGKFMCRGLIIIGILQTLTYTILILLNLQLLAEILNWIVMVMGTMILVTKSGSSSFRF